MIGMQELLVIFTLVLLLFGANKLPELARSLGQFMGEFKKAQKEAEYELSEFQHSKKAADQAKIIRIQKLAKDLGIETEGKTEDELLDEVQQTLSKQSVAKKQNV
ncbi:MAG: twin-arginine translocase TatA/TatE family subunit [Methanosarcinales archaeon Met12]|nr:MAG: twin-arginine translocase TatA/TatE family subunit [Methanosarcinales archaeon Met12]